MMIVEKEEESKEETKVEGSALEFSPETSMKQVASTHPWKESKKAKELTEKIVGNFTKRHQFLLSLIERIGLVDVETLLELPGIEGSETTLLSILIQNTLQPKNNHRREAIKNR